MSTVSVICDKAQIIILYFHVFKKSGVNINNFLNVLVSDPGPQCLMWLPVLHRMAQVENGRY